MRFAWKDQTKPKMTKVQLACGIAGGVLWALLTPVLVINLVLIFKSVISPGEIPSFAGYFPVIVQTPSMEGDAKDSFNDGDLIICRVVDAKDVQKGDVISFYDPKGSGTSVLTHRVEAVIKDSKGISFITKGDANESADSIAITESRLVGRYTGIRFAGVGNLAAAMQTTVGLVLVVIVPISLILIAEVLYYILVEQKKKTDMENALKEELEQLRLENEASNTVDGEKQESDTPDTDSSNGNLNTEA